MKLQNKWFIGAMLGAAVCLVSTSCVDEIKFGNSFLDKAPGGNATIDTVFNSAEYTRQFLNTCYSRQYYGLPNNTDSNGNIPDYSSPYLGKKDALTDCCHFILVTQLYISSIIWVLSMPTMARVVIFSHIHGKWYGK